MFVFFIIFQTVTELDLSSNKIANLGAENIALALQHNKVI